MKLNLLPFRKYKKVISNIIEKGSPFTENLYFDFQEGYCYFQNDSTFSRIKIEKAEENNIFIDAFKFLLLADSITENEIELKEGVFYDVNNSSYKLGDVDSSTNFETINFDEFVDHESFNKLFSENKDIFVYIKQASHYILKNDDQMRFNAVFIKDNYILGTNRVKMYKYYLNPEQHGEISDINIQEDVLRFLSNVDDLASVKFKSQEITEKKKDLMLSLDEGNCEIVIAENMELVTPPINDPSFIAQYDHETNIICDLKEITNVISFLFPFTSVDNNNCIYLQVTDDNKLKIAVRENTVKIEKYINLEEKNIETNKEFLISCHDLKMALLHLEGNELKLRLDDEKLLVNFSTFEDENRTILIAKMEE